MLWGGGLRLVKTVMAMNWLSKTVLVGHSMGNRIIGRAMMSLANERIESDMLRFREIIMIAPDIDAEVFRMDMAPRLARTGIHMTLYASSSDRALLASKAFHVHRNRPGRRTSTRGDRRTGNH